MKKGAKIGRRCSINLDCIVVAFSLRERRKREWKEETGREEKEEKREFENASAVDRSILRGIF